VTDEPVIELDEPDPPAPELPEVAFEPAVAAPPPPPPATLQYGVTPPLEFPPLLPCGGLTGGVFPKPPHLSPEPKLPPAPEPEPPFVPVVSLPAPPPPADDIVENIDTEPGLGDDVGDEAPPAPTVIGYVVVEIGKAPALQPGLGNVVR
jgi:hypothetical protein